MKTKIFKLLSVVMALAMVFTMFACVAYAEETTQDVVVEDGVYAAMMQGNIYKNNDTGALVVQLDNPERICTVNTYNVADYESIVIAAGFRANIVFLTAEGGFASNHAWKTGTVKIASLAGDAPMFRVVIAADPNANPFTPDMFPAEGLKIVAKAEEPEVPEEPEVEDSLTFTPEMSMGNVKTAVGGGLVLNPSVNTRITSKDLIAICDVEKIEIAAGYKAWYYTYTADGILTTNAKGEVKGSDAWKTGTYTAEDLAKISAEGVYFSVTVATEKNDAFAEAVLPEGVCVITKVVRPEMVQGNVKTAEGGGLVFNSSVTTRVTTKELLPIADYKMVKIGAGYKAWYYTYDANGILTNTTGCGAWKEGNFTAMALMGLSDKAVYFSVTVAPTGAGDVSPETLPKEAFALVKAPAPVVPEMAQGNVKTDQPGLVLNATVGTRITTKELLPLADFEKIVVAPGYKAWYYTFDADKNITNTNGCGGWKEGDYLVKDLAKISDKGVYFSVTLGTTNNDNLTPETLPADAFKLIVVGAYGACLEHDVKEYTSNGDATCTEDGTKTGACKVCGEAVTIKDEYSATGHKFDNAEDVDCNVCGHVRDLTVPCEHKYGKYTSNNDATCEEDGTKSATCLLCGEIDTVADEKTALGHDAEYVGNNDATCDQNATETGTCKRCAKEDTRPIEGSALGHKFASDDDDYCVRCGFERTRLVYYVYAGDLGGINTNDGLTAETPIATIEQAIKLATEAGAGIGDIVSLNIAGTVTWGGKIDGNWESITAHAFKLVFTSEDGKAIVQGTKNVILGGPVTYDNVTLAVGGLWHSFLANGQDFTFGKGYATDTFDLALGHKANLDVNKDVTFTFNAFFPKIWVGNTYHTANYNKAFTLNLNGNTRADGSVDTRAFNLVFKPGENGKVVYNGIASIINNTTNPLGFTGPERIVVGENGALNIISTVIDNPVDITAIAFTEDTLAKTWVINTSNMATITATEVAGEFAVQMGYIATATPVEGDAIKSAAGKLVLPAGQYDVSFTLCAEHVYDSDIDASCNDCGALREVFIPCEHVWSEYVFNNDATCETLGTETRTCSECGEYETRNVEGEAPGHIYGEDGFCTACGIYKVLERTLVKVDGVWYYYVDGFRADDTTVVKYNGTWYYVKGGIKNTSTTLCKYNGTWYYVKKGKIDFKATTLVKYNGKWYYVKNGKKNNSTTLVKYNGVWYYVKSGKKNTSTTLVKYNGVWYYVKSGKKSTATTLCKYNGKYYYVKKGKKNTSTTIVKYNGKKYYVKKGIAQTKFSGKVKINGKKYTVKKGVIK